MSTSKSPIIGEFWRFSDLPLSDSAKCLRLKEKALILLRAIIHGATYENPPSEVGGLNQFMLIPDYSKILATTPAPTVWPPSRIAKRKPSDIATGTINVTVNFTLSPGITISTPAGNSIVPVTSVVRK